MKHGKQTFRPQLPVDGPARGPSYPTFEVGRRRFLRRFGAVAGGALGFLVVGCTLAEADGSPRMPIVDWRRDVRRLDAGPPDGLDAEMADADTLDAEMVDGNTPDGNTPDGSTPDGSTVDAGSRDADTLDADTPDGSR